MGCCQSDFEIGEIACTQFENGDQKRMSGEDSFSDVSLESHEENTFGPFGSSRSKFGDSIVSGTRSTSNSLYRPDIESAFLHSPGLQRKFSISIPRNE